MPAQIFVWALLISLERHRHTLLKAQNETYVEIGKNSDNLPAMVSRFIEIHRVNFSDEEFPCECVMHNNALHITIKYQDKIVNRVLIDDRFGLTNFPFSNLK